MIRNIRSVVYEAPPPDIILEKLYPWGFDDTGRNTIAAFELSTGFKEITNIVIENTRISFNINTATTVGSINLEGYFMTNAIKLDIPQATSITLSNNSFVDINPDGNMSKITSFNANHNSGSQKVIFNINKFPALRNLIIGGANMNGLNLIGTCPNLIDLRVGTAKMRAADYAALMPFANALNYEVPGPYEYFDFLSNTVYDHDSPEFIALKKLLTSKGRLVRPW